jgi:hypothetical protein
MAVAVSPSVQLAAVISSGFYSIWFLFAGFLIPPPRMPVWWKWYSYLDPGAQDIKLKLKLKLKTRTQFQTQNSPRSACLLRMNAGIDIAMLRACTRPMTGHDTATLQ